MVRKCVVAIIGLLVSSMIAQASAAGIDTRNWMEQLAPYIEDRPITGIFLPGSHDSATYKLEDKFGKKQDITNQLNVLRYALVGFGVTKIARNWAKAQGRSVAQQLDDGVRFLDLRVIYRDSKKDFYTVHGLYGPSLNDVLSQINKFLQQNPKEIIIIQVGDLRYMPQGDKDHHALIARLKSVFGDRLVSKSMGLSQPIKTLWEQGKQVILVYNKSRIANQYEDIFPDNKINSYWTNTDNLSGLKNKLDKHLSNRKINLNEIYIIQSQMTANTDTIKSGLIPFSKGYKSLKDMAEAVYKELPGWLGEWHKKGPAIVLLDFTTQDTSKQIIALNLLQQKR